MPVYVDDMEAGFGREANQATGSGDCAAPEAIGPGRHFGTVQKGERMKKKTKLQDERHEDLHKRARKEKAEAYRYPFSILTIIDLMGGVRERRAK